MDTLLVLTTHGRKPGARLGLFGSGGGVSVTVSDVAARAGLTLPRLAPETRAALKRFNVPGTSVANPIDIPVWGLRDGERYIFEEIINRLKDDPGIDRVVVFVEMGWVLDFLDGDEAGLRTLQDICASIGRAKPGGASMSLALRSSGDRYQDDFVRATRPAFLAQGIPVFPSVTRAVLAEARVAASWPDGAPLMLDAHPTGRRVQFGIKRDVAGAFFGDFGPRSGAAVKSLPEQLAEQLVDQIINGDYAPGQRLGETALAERFEVSRGPVREALRLLEREGLVTVASWRGASVRKLSHKNLSDIFAVRAALMGLCAEQLAEDRPAHVLDTLTAGTRQLREASENGRVAEFIVIVYQLSMYLAEAPGNAVTFEVLFALGRQTLSLTRRAFEQIEHRESWAGNWMRIVEAIQSGDRDSARLAAQRLIAVIRVAAGAALDVLDAGDNPSGRAGLHPSGRARFPAGKPA